jgi:putative ABC transport system permease protein
MRAIRDALLHLRGRATRTTLTVSGIAIGILALVVVGSLAERLHEIVARSAALNAGTIFAVIEPAVLARGDAATVRRAGLALARLPGVARVVPEVVLPYRADDADDGRFGPPALIFGIPEAARAIRARTLEIREGRDARPDERRVAVVGADFAATTPAHPGDVISLYGNSYTVVGVFEKSFTLFDAAVVVPFADAQALLAQSVPPSLHALPPDGITAFLVVPDAGADASLVVARVNTVDGVTARDPADVQNAVQSTIRIFDTIVFGAALIALLVGAFSIVNTMTIAVAERTREIGIRKAIGATDADVLREFVIESAGIGAIGGAVGIALGAIVVTYVDARSAAGGNLELFALSPRVALGAFGFAVVLSIAAGFVPALGAARLAPTEALRHS